MRSTTHWNRRHFCSAGLAGVASLGACRGGDSDGAASSLRFSGIPDADKEQLTARYALVEAHLTRVLGREVKYEHVPDYTAAVTAVAAGKIELAWLGGVTAVQAETRTPGGVTFVAARASDLEFKSYFLANRAWVDEGKLAEVSSLDPQPLDRLAALGPILSTGTFSFGAKSSTSGHVMPRHFMQSEDVGFDPDTGFASPPAYQLKGGHSATLQAVASGSVDFGVVNYAAWERAEPALKRAAPVVYVTPHYVDYCLVAPNRVGQATIAAVRQAFVGLKDAGASDVLEAFSATEFVAVDPHSWDGIRAVVSALEADGRLS